MIKNYCDICGIETIKSYKLQHKLVVLMKYLFGDNIEYIFYENVCLKCQHEIRKTLRNKIKELRKGELNEM
jgi:hypothetical protein